MQTVLQNQIAQPLWLSQEPWLGDFHPQARDVTYFDRLEGKTQSVHLTCKSLGSWACPSGQLIAGSLIMDLKIEPDPNMILFVPKEPCEVTVTHAGPPEASEQAYISLRWNSSASKEGVNRAVIPRKDPWGETKDVFFVDKCLMALFDAGSFRERIQSLPRLDDLIDGILLKTRDQYNPLFRVDAPSGILTDTRSGTAAAIVEYESADKMVALHFDFMLLHGSGEDGEY